MSKPCSSVVSTVGMGMGMYSKSLSGEASLLLL